MTVARHVPRPGTAPDASLNFEAHPSNRDASAVGEPTFFAMGNPGFTWPGDFVKIIPRIV